MMQVRVFLAKRREELRMKLKIEYEAEMERIERDVWIAWVKRQKHENDRRYEAGHAM